jgi:hypothetical protein
MLNLYAKLKNPLSDYQSLYEKLINKDQIGELPWFSSANSFAFKLIKLPQSFIENNNTLLCINKKFTIFPFIFKVPANTNYNWHVDADRGLSINLPLNNHTQSHSYFLSDQTLGHLNSIHRLNYDLGYFYLFNTQIPHAVLNLHQDRYFFSITFKQPKHELTYSTVYDYCANNNLLDE